MQCFKRGNVDCSYDICKYEPDNQTRFGYGAPDHIREVTVCCMDNILKGMDAFFTPQDFKSVLLSGVPDEHMSECIESFDQLFLNSHKRDRPTCKFVVNLKNAKRAISTFDYPNFVYDRPTQLVFFDIDMGTHDVLMCFLYWLNAIKEGKETPNNPYCWFDIDRKMFSISTAGERFLTHGYGFFSSSVYAGMGIPRVKGYPIIYSKNHKLTFQEKKIFDGYGFDPLEK